MTVNLTGVLVFGILVLLFLYLWQNTDLKPGR